MKPLTALSVTLSLLLWTAIPVAFVPAVVLLIARLFSPGEEHDASIED